MYGIGAVRTDSFLIHNPGINRAVIPSELVMSSGTGLVPEVPLAPALEQLPEWLLAVISRRQQ